MGKNNKRKVIIVEEVPESVPISTVLFIVGVVLYFGYLMMGGMNELWTEYLVYISYPLGFLSVFFDTPGSDNVAMPFLMLYGTTILTLIIYGLYLFILSYIGSLGKLLLIFFLTLFAGSVATYYVTKDSTDRHARIDNVSKDIKLAIAKIGADPREKVKLEAIRDMENTSEDRQPDVVKQNGPSIQYVKNPSEAVQMAAINSSYDLIKYIENPTEAVQLAAMKRNPHAIEYIKNPTEAVQIVAAKSSPVMIQYIKNPSEAVQLAAIKKYPSSLFYIYDKSEAAQMAAVNRDGTLIKYIAKPSEAVQLAAIKNNPSAINGIRTPCKAAQMAAR